MLENTSNTFDDLSQRIANDFIQSIVFLDDAAYSLPNSNPKNEFDTLKVSQVFAKEKKICSVYCPQSSQDIDDFCYIAEKADIVILDWYIKLTTTKLEPDEADAESEDIRGKYTKKIIEELAKNNDSLKLIIVYTGETDLVGITKEINKIIPSSAINEEKCSLYLNNIKVIIRAKSNLNPDDVDEKFKHNQQLKDKVIPYDQLPKYVLDEFTEMTLGILPNIALQSLTAIRKNTSKILNLFSKELDAAYLGHKTLLPVQTDAEPFLLELFVDTIFDLLSYQNISDDAHQNLIPAWIEYYIKDNKNINNICDISITKELLDSILKIENSDVDNRLSEVLKINSSKKARNRADTELFSKLFLNENELNIAERIELQFAKLAQNKSLLLPREILPHLTSGTIIKMSNNPNSYFICIQQACDSTRITSDENRRFLFLPLERCRDEQNVKVDFITAENLKLKLKKKTYDIKTIRFNPNNGQGTISSINEDDNFIFTDIYGEKYQWIVDIKRLQVQKIAVDYAASLARVGINQSEFLRRRS